jgi:hypothetical protein
MLRLWIFFDTDIQGCSTGYSVYVMGAIDGDCLLNVCLKFETFHEIRNFPVVVLSPFFDIELINGSAEINETVDSGVITIRMINNFKTAKAASLSSSKSHQVELGLSIGAIFIGVFGIATV